MAQIIGKNWAATRLDIGASEEDVIHVVQMAVDDLPTEDTENVVQYAKLGLEFYTTKETILGPNDGC